YDYDYILFSLFLKRSAAHRHLHSFPTRRSSDLPRVAIHLSNGLRQRNPFGASVHAVLRVGAFLNSPGSHDRREPLALVHRSRGRSEEHTSELQSRGHLVCRLLLEKKKYMIEPKI